MNGMGEINVILMMVNYSKRKRGALMRVPLSAS